MPKSLSKQPTRLFSNFNPIGVRDKDVVNRFGVMKPDKYGYARFSQWSIALDRSVHILFKWYLYEGCNTVEKIVAKWLSSDFKTTEKHITRISSLSTHARDETLLFNYEGIGMVIHAMSKVISATELMPIEIKSALTNNVMFYDSRKEKQGQRHH